MEDLRISKNRQEKKTISFQVNSELSETLDAVYSQHKLVSNIAKMEFFERLMTIGLEALQAPLNNLKK